MIDKVIKLKDDLQYYVLDEFVKDRRIFLFAIQVDNAKEIVTDKCIVCEVKYKNDGLVVDNISNVREMEEINNIFISRLTEKKESE